MDNQKTGGPTKRGTATSGPADGAFRWCALTFDQRDETKIPNDVGCVNTRRGFHGIRDGDITNSAQEGTDKCLRRVHALDGHREGTMGDGAPSDERADGCGRGSGFHP